jgi:Domain of unknown function (DUF6457)
MWTPGKTWWSCAPPASDADVGGHANTRVRVLARSAATYQAWRVNLHDWIDELCDALDIETEVDEGLVLDLARDAAHHVERPAAPITTYLLGYAAALHDANPERLEGLAAAATELAQKWDREDAEPDEPDVAIDLEGLDETLVDVD